MLELEFLSKRHPINTATAPTKFEFMDLRTLVAGYSFQGERDMGIDHRVEPKNLAKSSDMCSVRADGLCIGGPRLVGGRKAGNSNKQDFFLAPRCTGLGQKALPRLCEC